MSEDTSLASAICETYSALVECDPRIEDWDYLLEELPELANRAAAADAKYHETEAECETLRAALRLAVSAGECEGPWAYTCDSSDQPHQHEQRDRWCAWCQAKAVLADTEKGSQ